jgi:outer membrane immunogenic protein
MKMVVLAGSILALASGAASAADMAIKAAIAPPPPVLSWAGFYIGGHGGYGWKDDPFSEIINFNPAVFINGFQSRGWLAGGQFGYNWQYAAVVGGVELDVSATGIKGNSATVTFTSGNQTVSETAGNDVKLLGSARGRLGWAPGSWLLYGTGGLAWEQLEQTFTFTQTFTNPNAFTNASNSIPFNLFGWVAGAGVETLLFGTNWIGRLEYLHYDFGKWRNSTVITTNLPGNFSYTNTAGNQTIDVVRAGLSYKFGS